MLHFVFLKQENHKNNKKTLLSKESVRNQKIIHFCRAKRGKEKVSYGTKSDFMQLSYSSALEKQEDNSSDKHHTEE